MPPPKARRTLRESLEATQRSLDLYAALSGRERVMVAMPPAPKPRLKAATPPRADATEAQILKACMQYLRHHPRVALVYRVNSGTFGAQNRDGSTRYIRANTQRGMTDIAGTMSDGRALYVEIKSRTGRVQPHQEAFLLAAQKAGAIAGVVRSVDDLVALLDTAGQIKY